MTTHVVLIVAAVLFGEKPLERTHKQHRTNQVKNNGV
jgi:hypothetical protein